MTGSIPTLPEITAPDLATILSGDDKDTASNLPLNIDGLRFMGERAVDFVIASHIVTTKPGLTGDVLRVSTFSRLN